MRKYLITWTLFAASLSSGCAFYHKAYVSEIVLDGTNHRPEFYDEGAFYLNAEPTIRMRMGCLATTTMLETMSLIIPFPFGRETPPHESIASEPFSLRLRHYGKDGRAGLDLSALPIEVEIDGRVVPLALVHKSQERNDWHWEYEFAADLPCGDVQDGTLRIQLDAETTRTYGVNFEEGVQREFAWHPTFVT